MWWAGSESRSVADAYVGNRRVMVQWRGEVLLDEPLMDWRLGLKRLKVVLDTRSRGQRLRLFLSGGLCRPFLMQQISGAKTAKDWLLISQAMASEATGLVGPCDVWLDPRSDVPRLAVALDESAKQLIVDTLGARLLRLQPWWGEVLKLQALADERCSALAVQDCDSLTLLFSEASKAQGWVMAQSSAMESVIEPLSTVNRMRMSMEWSGDKVDIVRLKRPGWSAENSSGSRTKGAVFAEAVS